MHPWGHTCRHASQPQQRLLSSICIIVSQSLVHYKGRESRLDLGSRNDAKGFLLRHDPRKSNNSSVEIFKPPVRNEEIPPNFDFILPKFHFILPNFYFGPRWGIFVCSLAVHDFLMRDRNQSRPRSHYSVAIALRSETQPIYSFFVVMRSLRVQGYHAPVLRNATYT